MAHVMAGGTRPAWHSTEMIESTDVWLHEVIADLLGFASTCGHDVNEVIAAALARYAEIESGRAR